MKRVILFFAVAACGIFSVNISAAAEDRNSAYRLDPIVVTSSRTPEMDTGYPTSDTVLRSSKSVEVIGQAEIERSGVRSVPELLKSQVGVVVNDYFGNGKRATVDLRGFGETAVSNVLVMIDGRRTNTIDMSGTDWSQINIDSIERIEIVRGAQSVLYGDNAMGGVINIITKKGREMKPEIGLGYQTGSYHYNSYSGYAQGGTHFLDYYIGLSSSGSRGYRGNSDLETGDIVSTLTARPSDNINIRFNSGYHKDWYGQPGAMTDVQIERFGMRGSRKPGDRSKTEEFHIMPGIDINGHDKDAGLTFSADMIVDSRRSASLFDQTTYWFEQNDHIKTFGVTPKVIFESRVGDILSRTIFGVDCYNYKAERLSSNWNNVTFGDRMQKDKLIVEEDTIGIYGTETLTLNERLSVNGGFRSEWARYRFDQQAIAQTDTTKEPYEYAFEGGASYKYGERSSVYGNISRSFRLPAVDEWFQAVINYPWGTTGGLNLDLEPQTAMNYELGVKDHTLEWLKMNADYFLIDTRHEIFYDPWVTFVNAVYDRTIRHGLELEAHILPAKDLDAYAKYTYEKAFFVGSHYAGNEVPMVPRHKITWGLAYTFMDCVDFNYVANFVGDRRFISDQRNVMRRMKYYITNDVRVAYRKLGLEIFAAINNIFDYDYSAIGSYGQYYPSNGRNFIIGTKYKF